MGRHGGYGLRFSLERSPAAPDYRDFMRGPHRGVPAFTLAPYLLSLGTFQQGQTSTCVECVDMLRYDHLQLVARVPQAKRVRLSPEWWYGVTHAPNDLVEGTDPLRALEVERTQGGCPWPLDPFTNMALTAREAIASLHPSQYGPARRHRIGAWAAIPPTLEHIRAATNQGHLVAVAGAVFPAFESPQAMALRGESRELTDVLGGEHQIHGVVPGSWLKQGALGGHQFIVAGTAPAKWFAWPISEGCLDYCLCLTTWGLWVPGPVALFALPAPYLRQVYRATVIPKMAA